MISDSQASALDAALRLAEEFEATVCKHPFICAHPALVAHCEQVGLMLGALYQEIGVALRKE